MAGSIKGNAAAERCLDCPARESCIFVELPAEALAELQSLQQVRIYSRGTWILRQGDRASGIALVRSGWVKLFRILPDGRAATLGLVGPGSLLGWREALTGNPCEVGAEALEESHIEVVGKEEFLRFLRGQPQLAIDLLTAVSSELGRLLVDLSELSGKLPTPERLLRVLRDLAECCGRADGEGTRIRLALTVQDLADRIGCTRQWASRLLGDLEDSGMIRRQRGWVTLTPLGLDRHRTGGVYTPPARRGACVRDPNRPDRNRAGRNQ